MRRIAVVAVLVMILLSWGMAFAFQNEPEGFRGLKWGDPPGKDMIFKHKSNNDSIFWYARESDKLQMGRARFRCIRYLFYKNRFMQARIEGEAFFRKNLLKEIVQLRFGPCDKYTEWIAQGRAVASREWFGEISTVTLTTASTSELGRYLSLLTIRSTKLVDEFCEEDDECREAREKERKAQEAIKKGLDDF